MKLSKSEKTYKGFCIGISTLIALLCLYPLLYTVFISLCTKQELVERGGMLFFFPSNPTFEAYGKIFRSGSFIMQALMISVLRTLIGTVAGVFITAITAFVLSRKDLPGKKPYLYLILFTILFNGGLIPTYLTIQGLGLLNTFWVMIIPLLLNTWNVLVFKQFFEGLPKELEEAAEVDGVTNLQLFIKIVIPMSKPVIAAIALFTMVAHWNSWFDASIYIDQSYRNLWPLQLYTRVMFDNSSNMTQSGLDFLINNANISDTSMKMALTIVTLIPILLVYPFFQKYFTKGVYLGAVKG